MGESLKDLWELEERNEREVESVREDWKGRPWIGVPAGGEGPRGPETFSFRRKGNQVVPFQRCKVFLEEFVFRLPF